MRLALSSTRPLNAVSLISGLIFKEDGPFKLRFTIFLLCFFFSGLFKLLGLAILLIFGDCYVSCLDFTWVLLGVMYGSWKIMSIGSDYFQLELEGIGLPGFLNVSQEKREGVSDVPNIVYIWGDEKSPASSISMPPFSIAQCDILPFRKGDLTFTCQLLVKC